MTRPSLPPLVVVTSLLVGSATTAAQPSAQAGSLDGRCDSAPPLEGMLRTNDGVSTIVNISCDRMVLGGATAEPEISSVTFSRRGRSELRLAGRWTSVDTLTIESVELREREPLAATGGRCRFYARDAEFEIAMCFAKYADGNRNAAVVVAFTRG